MVAITSLITGYAVRGSSIGNRAMSNPSGPTWAPAGATPVRGGGRREGLGRGGIQDRRDERLIRGADAGLWLWCLGWSRWIWRRTLSRAPLKANVRLLLQEPDHHQLRGARGAKATPHVRELRDQGWINVREKSYRQDQSLGPRGALLARRRGSTAARRHRFPVMADAARRSSCCRTCNPAIWNPLQLA